MTYEQRGYFDVAENGTQYIVNGSLPVRITKGELKLILNVGSSYSWWKHYATEEMISAIGFESMEDFKRLIKFSPHQTKRVYAYFKITTSEQLKQSIPLRVMAS